MDWSRASRRILNRTALALAGAALSVLSLAPLARAADVALLDQASRIASLKQTARHMMMQGAEGHIQDARAAEAWRRWKATHPHAHGAERVRKVSDRDEAAPPLGAFRVGHPASPGARPTAAQTVPTNVRCNNPAGDAAGAGQSEEYIARWGSYVLVAWNDGQGFNTGGDIQNYAYSTDGGATFTQPAGGIPHPAGATGFVWASDPSVTVNEKTGEFFFAALCDSGVPVAGFAPFSGLAVAKCTFPGGSAPPVWGATHTVRTVNTQNDFIDKEWVAVDSLTGRVFVTYTLFTATEDSIEFQRSQDGGATWGPILICNSDSSAGWVQGSRAISGANGEVYVTWNEIGQTTAFDHMRIRKSVNGGASFGSEAEICKLYANFGSGAPGFNRLLGITFPSIAVDRTGGPHRGRVYVSWNESINWGNDPLGGGGNLNEVEANNSTGTANPFTPGQRLRGTIGSTSDGDFFSFSATQGTNYIFFADSLTSTLEYTMLVYCSDGGTRLALSGADSRTQPGFNQSFIDWTCPASGTYFLRMAANGSTGSYRVDTGINGPNTGERSRDHRDIFVAHSDDGSVWAPATRANDDPPYFDDWLPEVTVGADGMAYVAWYDWRNAAANCGGSSNVYVSRSADGGATWEPSQPVTSVATAWSAVASNIAPNQGDYVALRSDGRSMMPSWADGRSGDPDVWATNFDTGFDFTSCPSITTVATGAALPLTFSWVNANSVFPNSYTYRLTDTAGWMADGPTTLNVAASATASVPYNITVPDSTYDVNDITFQVSNATGAMVQQCKIHLTVTGHVGPPPVGFAFALSAAVPNPASTSTRIAFTLPQAGQAKLVIYGIHGERVRTLLDGSASAGPNSITWDGLDDRGQRVRAGVYFYRLESPGHRADRRLVYTP
jgi:hypothetical protein